MLAKSRRYNVVVGSFNFLVESNITGVQQYLENHYSNCIVQDSNALFIDYKISLNHGPFYRRFYKPQAIFSFNHHIPFKPLPLDQAHAFLEWGMNWVVANHANHYLALHAAAVEKNGKAVIISATSGSGKSTLCAYLVSQGWRLLSDELALIAPDTLMVHGLGRPISLKNESIDLIRPFYQDDSFSTPVSDTKKGTISLVKPPLESMLSAHRPAQPAHLIFVSYNPDETCYSEQVEKCLALTEVVKNSFNFGVLNTHGFDCARRLVDSIDVSYIEYSNFQACENTIMNLICKEN